MKQYLKSYQVVMQTEGPVFIGSGRKIEKKEYLFFSGSQAGILDIEKFYKYLKGRCKTREFEEYMLGGGINNLALAEWLNKQKIKKEELKPYMKYTLDYSGEETKRMKGLQLMECIKDAYGCPYIPGSSLKGMFRTILLANDIRKSPKKYQKEKDSLKNHALSYGDKNDLKKDITKIESTAFRTLKREKTGQSDAVNDCLQGFIVSDSEPLPVSSLVLCQKKEFHTNGQTRGLPLLRECIRPGTEICFHITVDTSVCQITSEDLLEAVRCFADSYYDNFAAAFPGFAKPGENTVYLGGGCGFVSKTVIYPMYGKEEGIKVTNNVFKKTLGGLFKTHKHAMDQTLGVSPHILKCTDYQGKTVQMGLCRIKSIEPEDVFSHAP